jgi:hypothetical protein
MGKLKAAAQHDQRMVEKRRETNTAREPKRLFAEAGRHAKQQTATGQEAALKTTFRAGSRFADGGGGQEIAAAWARYIGDCMGNTSEASRALLRARNFRDMLEIQADLLCNNLQAFLEQSARVAEAATHMATRSFKVPRQTPWNIDPDWRMPEKSGIQ